MTEPVAIELGKELRVAAVGEHGRQRNRRIRRSRRLYLLRRDPRGASSLGVEHLLSGGSRIETAALGATHASPLGWNGRLAPAERAASMIVSAESPHVAPLPERSADGSRGPGNRLPIRRGQPTRRSHDRLTYAGSYPNGPLRRTQSGARGRRAGSYTGGGCPVRRGSQGRQRPGPDRMLRPSGVR